jgi:hypothetical protein
MTMVDETATTQPDPARPGPGTPPEPVDGDKLMAFVFRAVEEVGATLNSALVVMGDTLGYYRALAADGPSTPTELARRTETGEKYAREWLNAQAAGGYLTYDPGSGRYTLPPEQTVALTDETSPAFLPGFFQLAWGTVRDSERIITAARTGDGMGWHEHNSDVHVGCERFFRPGYLANLVPSWLPALEDVVPKLQTGGTVADLGCGYGASTRPSRPHGSSGPTTTTRRSPQPARPRRPPGLPTVRPSRRRRRRRSRVRATTW